MKKKLLTLSLGLVLLIFSHEFILAWDDWTFGPTATISGPTEGVVGQEYTFSASISSTEETPINQGIIFETTNSETSQGSNRLVREKAAEGSDICSPLECNITGTFKPLSPGTYYIFVLVGFFSNPENQTATSCNTHPAITEASCFNSRGEYITFVVEEVGETPPPETPGETTLPKTAIIPTKTYILVSTGLLLLLLSSYVKKMGVTESQENENRKTFEKRFR
jgi:hypothetical protein